MWIQSVAINTIAHFKLYHSVCSKQYKVQIDSTRLMTSKYTSKSLNNEIDLFNITLKLFSKYKTRRATGIRE